MHRNVQDPAAHRGGTGEPGDPEAGRAPASTQADHAGEDYVQGTSRLY